MAEHIKALTFCPKCLAVSDEVVNMSPWTNSYMPECTCNKCMLAIDFNNLPPSYTGDAMVVRSLWEIYNKLRDPVTAEPPALKNLRIVMHGMCRRMVAALQAQLKGK